MTVQIPIGMARGEAGNDGTVLCPCGGSQPKSAARYGASADIRRRKDAAEVEYRWPYRWY